MGGVGRRTDLCMENTFTIYPSESDTENLRICEIRGSGEACVELEFFDSSIERYCVAGRQLVSPTKPGSCRLDILLENGVRFSVERNVVETGGEFCRIKIEGDLTIYGPSTN